MMPRLSQLVCRQHGELWGLGAQENVQSGTESKAGELCPGLLSPELHNVEESHIYKPNASKIPVLFCSQAPVTTNDPQIAGWAGLSQSAATTMFLHKFIVGHQAATQTNNTQRLPPRCLLMRARTSNCFPLVHKLSKSISGRSGFAQRLKWKPSYKAGGETRFVSFASSNRRWSSATLHLTHYSSTKHPAVHHKDRLQHNNTDDSIKTISMQHL